MQHRAKSCTPKTKAVSSSMFFSQTLWYTSQSSRVGRTWFRKSLHDKIWGREIKNEISYFGKENITVRQGFSATNFWGTRDRSHRTFRRKRTRVPNTSVQRAVDRVKITSRTWPRWRWIRDALRPAETCFSKRARVPLAAERG